ncbi:MAG: hypothetical protein ACPLKZ_02770 [Candidatus Bathyarchaeales archaeon]
MSVDIPKMALAFGSVAIPQADVLEARITLACTEEASRFEALLQNWDKKYSPGEANAINVGVDGHIDVGRGVNVPQLITCKVEEVRFMSDAVAHYVKVSGRGWDERLFRALVTKTYANMKGEAIVKDLLDSYAGLSHNRGGTELVEDTDTTYQMLKYEDTPVIDILQFIAGSADKNGIIGYDFRVAPDGKFEFFPRGSKISSVSLSELIETAEYDKDIHSVRNKITVYGAQDYKLPSDCDSWSDGQADWLMNDDAEDAHNNTAYQLVGQVTYDPSPTAKIIIDVVELQCRMSGGSGKYKITYQKEGGAETIIVTDQAFNNTSYELKQHILTGANRIIGDIGKDVTIRHYTLTDNAADTVYSKNHRAVGDIIFGDWLATEGKLYFETTTKMIGNGSIRCYCDGVYNWGILLLNLPQEADCTGFTFLDFRIYLDSSRNGSLNLLLYDYAGKWAFKYLTLAVGEWVSMHVPCNQANASEWAVQSGFDWSRVAAVKFWTYGSAGGNFYIDGFNFNGAFFKATQEDAASQGLYGKREKIEHDEELYSNNECSLRAKALLAYWKDPIEYMTLVSRVIDYGTTPVLPGDKIHVTLPNENMDADWVVLSAVYYVNAKEQYLEITLNLGRQKPLLADYLFAARRKTDHLSRHKQPRLI